MKPNELKYFETLLNSWLEQLTSNADSTVTYLMSSRESVHDPIDQASCDSDRDFTLRIRDRESRLIYKIRRSLDNIENGTFGLCDMCDEEIAIARLRARPVTMHCISCKRQLEADEKYA